MAIKYINICAVYNMFSPTWSVQLYYYCISRGVTFKMIHCVIILRLFLICFNYNAFINNDYSKTHNFLDIEKFNCKLLYQNKLIETIIKQNQKSEKAAKERMFN